MVNIKRYSAIQAEDEVLLMPGCIFTVSSKLDAGNGLTIIQLSENTNTLLTGFKFEKKTTTPIVKTRKDGAIVEILSNNQGIITFTKASELFHKNDAASYHYVEGSVYKGSLDNDHSMHGVGTHTRVKGDVYEGDWKLDKRFGKGTLKLVNGDTYTGEYRDDRKNGQGTYKWSCGDTYTGEYRDDKRNGQGTFKFSDGDTYTGELKDDYMNGQGTFKWSCGDIYTGEFKDHKMNGHGKFIFKSGATWEGKYENGNPCGTAINAHGWSAKCSSCGKKCEDMSLFWKAVENDEIPVCSFCSNAIFT